ncbi:MAG TPA: hypothetical protein VN017_05455 [Pseudoxanthomonas sp.]|nr:hypothetical protein [Pseudoxanthomonas sp.]
MNYTLDLAQPEVQLLLQGLGELPLKFGLALFGKIQAQVRTQDEQSAIHLTEVAESASGVAP